MVVLLYTPLLRYFRDDDKPSRTTMSAVKTSEAVISALVTKVSLSATEHVMTVIFATLKFTSQAYAQGDKGLALCGARNYFLTIKGHTTS